MIAARCVAAMGITWFRWEKVWKLGEVEVSLFRQKRWGEGGREPVPA
ncbi:hypothetical protein RRG08_046130, partial [Elysia crispata]